ncbi:MAG: phosphomannomutase/phosphoglucomutase [Myxococcota bacterium]
MTFNPHVFREYDIRGVADSDFPDVFVGDLGRAIGTFLARCGAGRIALGRDCRLHGPRIHDALLEGLLETGLTVLDVGVVPTPLVYFSTFELDLDGAVQITGSHNPPQDNGFKICRGKQTIFGEDVQAIRRLCETRDFLRTSGGRHEEVDIASRYLANVASNVRVGPRRFGVVVDAGNGAGGPVGAAALEALGLPVTRLFCEMDGSFPNHHPDPTMPENVETLRREVLARGAEVGIAYDGDADRLGVIDGRGRTLYGDQILMLFARALLAEQPGAMVVSEVKCSQALFDDIAARGGRPLMWKVGHSLIKAKMKEEKALLGGEMSGHFFFAHRWFGFDDAIYASLRLCELLSRGEKTLAELRDELPDLATTPEIRVDCPDGAKFEVVRRVAERLRGRYPIVDVDGVRVKVDGGWGLVRASNTQPVLVLRFEADSEARLAEIRAMVEGEIVAARREVGV